MCPPTLVPRVGVAWGSATSEPAKADLVVPTIEAHPSPRQAGSRSAPRGRSPSAPKYLEDATSPVPLTVPRARRSESAARYPAVRNPAPKHQAHWASQDAEGPLQGLEPPRCVRSRVTARGPLSELGCSSEHEQSGIGSVWPSPIHLQSFPHWPRPARRLLASSRSCLGRSR